jgi:hypothetical protein
MKSGRASAEDNRVAVSNLPERPKPLSDLTPDEKAEWVHLVDSCPANYFESKHYPAMASYCRHVVRNRDLSGELNKLDPSDPEQIQHYKNLHSMMLADSKAALAIERSFRLTHQSQRDRAKKTPTGGLRDRF